MGSCFSKKVEFDTTQEPLESSSLDTKQQYVDPLEITLESPPSTTTQDNISDISMESNKGSSTTSEEVGDPEFDSTVTEENEVKPVTSASSSVVIPVDVPKTATIIESQMDETLLHAFCEDVLHVIHTSSTETGRPKYEDIRYVDDIQDIKKIVLSLGKQRGSWEKVQIKDVVYVIRMLTYEQMANRTNETSDSEPVTAEMIYKKKLEENQLVE